MTTTTRLAALDEALADLTPDERRAATDILLGWISEAVPAAVWTAGIEHAVQAAQR